ncbi:hypothetical protein C8Q78DRAFT_333907 [Trametes maxima]|nr:hypothetical protein C8Q78DRAFT_333907 [Trametes maxima]
MSAKTPAATSSLRDRSVFKRRADMRGRSRRWKSAMESEGVEAGRRPTDCSSCSKRRVQASRSRPYRRRESLVEFRGRTLDLERSEVYAGKHACSRRPWESACATEELARTPISRGRRVFGN